MDNEKLEIGFNSPGVELIERAVSALDNLHKAMAQLGSGSAGASLKSVESQMQIMQASMTTGFTEIEVRLNSFEAKTKAVSKTSMQAAMDEERWINARLEGQRRYAAGVVEADDRAITSLEKLTSAIAKASTRPGYLAAGPSWWEEELAKQEKASAQLEASYQKSIVELDKLSKSAIKAVTQPGYLAAGPSWWEEELAKQEKASARLESNYQKSIVELDKLAKSAIKAVTQPGYVPAGPSWWDTELAKEEAALERMRLLNTKFLAASPGAQLSTAKEAQVYGSLGGDVTAKYGTSAAGLASNTAEYAKLEQAAKASAGAIDHHNQAMQEGHAFARGLSGALGTLWITYGSLVPLLAGAAIAGSLKKIYDIGKDVEYQLAFVKALTDTPVDLDKFLAITSGTVVSIHEAAEGMRALAQNGLNAQQSLQALPAILNLATIGEMSVSQAALSATGVLTAFNLELSELGRVGDVFAKAAATSNTSVAGMTESMKTASTASSLFGVSLEETAASIGVLAKLNIVGTAAGTSFRNILKDLYEPTKKQADAQKALGISTRDSSDQLKNYVQVLSDIRAKTAALSEGGKLNFLSQLSDERGAKALIATLANWDEFTAKIEEAKNAAGFTAEAVVKLEDTVQGASKRMANNIQDTFIKAFSEASPIIQRTVTELGDLAKSKDLVSFFSGLAEGVANLTRFIVEHASTIKTLLEVYIGFKTLTYAVASYQALAIAMGTSTAVTTAEAAATRMATAIKTAYTGAVASSTLTLVGENVVMGAATVTSGMLATATTFLAGTFRLLVASLGPIALAVTAAVTVYELFIKRASETDKELLRNSNTLNVINEDLDKQIDKLAKRNALWNPKTFEHAPEDIAASDSLAKAKLEVNRAQALVDQAERVAADRLQNQGSSRGTTRANNEVAEYRKVLEEKKSLLKAALDEEASMVDKRRDEQQDKELDAFRSGQENLIKELKKFRAQADAIGGYTYTKDGQKVEGSGHTLATPAQSEVYQGADSLIAAVKAAATPADLKDIISSFDALKAKLSEVSQGYEKADPSKLNQAYAAAKEKITEALQLREREIKQTYTLIELKAKNGDAGPMELITAEGVKNVEVALAKMEAAHALADLAAKRSDKPGDIEKAVGEWKKARQDASDAIEVQDQKLANYETAMEQETTKNYIQELTARKQYRKAAEVEAEADFGKTIRGLKADIVNFNLDESNSAQFPVFNKMLKELDGFEKKFEAKVNAGKMKELAEGMKTAGDQVAEVMSNLQLKAKAAAGIFDRDSLEETIGSLGLIRDEFAATGKAAEDLFDKTGDPQAFQVFRAAQKDVAKLGNDILALKQKLAMGPFTELAKNFASLGDSFKGIATAITGVGEAYTKLITLSELESQGEKIKTQDRIGAYGDMASAAKGFFGENTAGYRALDGAAKIFHTAQVAMNLVEMAQLAIKAVMSQGSGDPYTAWPRMAAMAAVMAGLGFAVGGGFDHGGGGGQTAAEVQKTQGTGSVFGDATAKSESIVKSMEILKNNSNMMLPVNQGMLAALKNIEASMTGLTNLLIRTPGVAEGTNLGIATGQINAKGSPTDIVSNVMTGVTKILFPVIGGGIASFINNLWGKTTQNIVDSGIKFGGSLSALQAGQGYNQYASVDTTTSSWFGLSKSTSNSVQTQNLNQELSNQFGLIFTSLEKTLQVASGSLGSSATDVEKALSQLEIAPTTLSLKGLTGQALTDALNAVISKTMDEIAMTALPGLDQFRAVGEGYAQTVIRVASGIEEAKGALEKFGIAAIDFKYVTDKQGDVGAEIVRQSIMAVEVIKAHYDAGAIGATVYASSLNGIGEIMKNMQGTASELATEYQALLDVRKLLRASNTDDQLLSLSMIKGAGGQSELTNGLQAYNDKFFTDAEKNASALKELNMQFEDLGVTSIPKTHKEFRSLVEGIDLTTEAGQRLFGGLVTLSSAFDTASAAAEAAAALVIASAATARREDVAIRNSADEAIATAAKTAADALQVLVKAAQDSIPNLLKAGNATAALSANLMGVFTSATFSNEAAARFNARAGVQMAGQVSANALQTQDAGKVIADLLSRSLSNDFNESMAREVKGGLGITMGTAVSDVLHDMFLTAGKMLAMRDFAPQGPGIANVIAARAQFAFDSDTKSYRKSPGSDDFVTVYGKDIQAYKDALSSLDFALKTGKITQEEYAVGLVAVDRVMKDAKDLAGDMAAQLARVNEDAQRLVNSGLSSIGYYFGEITKGADALAAAAAAANTPLNQTETAIGRLTSLATVLGSSVSAVVEGLDAQIGVLTKQLLASPDGEQRLNLAAQLKSVQYDRAHVGDANSMTGNADLIARTAAMASAAMTTSDASKAAASLATSGAFAGSLPVQIRDFSLLLDGVKQFDPAGFENSFTRINAALIKGVINQDQYNALFSEGIGIFNTGKTTLENAQASATQAAKDAAAAASASAAVQETATKTLADTFLALQKAAQSLTDSLLLDTKFSPLSPEQQIAEASAQYYRTLNDALSGDANAVDQYQAVAKTYLDTIEANASSQSQLTAGVASVLSNDAIITSYDTSNQTQEAMLAELKLMKQEIAQLRAANESSALSDSKQAVIMAQFQSEGMPTYTVTAP
jgi:TP901 family phage tail tape measure protein